MDKNTGLFVIYRDNDLFRTHVHRILEGLNVVGTYVVPRGIAFDAVRDEAIAAAEQALANGARLLVTDQTCSSVNSILTEGESRPRNRFSRKSLLDYIFRNQIDAGHPKNTVADNVAWFADQVTGKRTVKSAIIVQSRISDHCWAGKDNTELPRSEAEKSKWLAKQLNAIFPDSDVKIVETFKEALEFAGDPETLLVLDRHCGVKEVMSREGDWYNSLSNWPHACMLFQLPFETCAANLVSRGNVGHIFEIEAMRNLIFSNCY